jgi:hypothetical protein
LRGKPWSIEEERLLRQLIEGGKGIDEIAHAMGKSRTSIKGKLNNLGLSLVVVATRLPKAVATTTTSLAPIIDSATLADPALVVDPALAEEIAADLKKKRPLPSIEEKMREMDDASRALKQPGLSATEVARLGKFIEAAKVYNLFFEKYMHYRDLENELVELRRRLASEISKK